MATRASAGRLKGWAQRREEETDPELIEFQRQLKEMEAAAMAASTSGADATVHAHSEAAAAVDPDAKRSVVLVEVDEKTGKPTALFAKMTAAEIAQYELQQEEHAKQILELRRKLKEQRKQELTPQGKWTPLLEQLYDGEDWDILNGEEPLQYAHDPWAIKSMAHRRGYCSEAHPASLQECPVDAVLRAQQEKSQAQMMELHRTASQIRADTSACGCVRRGDVAELLQLLRARPEAANECDSDGNSPLHWAMLQDAQSESMAQALIACSANIDARNNKSETPLHWAAYKGNNKACQVLLDRGADLFAKHNQGMTPMHKASQTGQTMTMEWLHRRGASLNGQDGNLKSPLHWTVYNGHHLSTLWLIARGANIAIKDKEQAYPLHWAAIKGHSEVAEALLEAGAKPQLHEADETGSTPLMLALGKMNKAKTVVDQKRYKSVIKVLKSAQRDEERAKRFFGLEQKLFHASSKVWANGFVLWCALMYFTVYVNYISFILPATSAHLSILWPILFHVLLIGNFCWWRLAAYGNPGYIEDGFEGDPMDAVAGFQTVPRPASGEAGADDGNASTSTSTSTSTSSSSSSSSSSTSSYVASVSAGSSSATTGSSSSSSFSSSYRELKRSYDNALEAPDNTSKSFCVTCCVERPLRSKHCSQCKRCVYRFDHHCPVINNCVGGGNYMYFIGWMVGLFVLVPLYQLQFIYALRYSYPHLSVTQAAAQHPFASLWAMHTLVYLFLAGTMLKYHIPLVLTNLTTNEASNRARYAYLLDERGAYRNPFSRHPLDNLRFFFGLAPGASWMGLMDVAKTSLQLQLTLGHTTRSEGLAGNLISFLHSVFPSWVPAATASRAALVDVEQKSKKSLATWKALVVAFVTNVITSIKNITLGGSAAAAAAAAGGAVSTSSSTATTNKEARGLLLSPSRSRTPRDAEMGEASQTETDF